MSEHLAENATLYALGSLSAWELAAADEHLRACDACRRLLALAQADVSAIEAALPQIEPPAGLGRRLARSLNDTADALRARRLVPATTWLSVAAAFAIAIAPAGYLAYQNASMHATMAADAQALARIASSPHRVANFTGLDAEVMYGVDGSWYCIIIRQAQRSAQVFWPHDGTQTMLGTALPRGDIALLYLAKSHRMNSLSIVQGGKTVAQARLNFDERPSRPQLL